MKIFVSAVVLVLAMLMPRAAEATLIPANCDTCGAHNTSWEITYSLYPDDQGGDLHNIYQFVVTATYDPLGDDASGLDFYAINAIAFKVDAWGANDYENGTPQVAGATEGNWQVVFGGLSADGCNDAGNGFWCANSLGIGMTHSATPAGTTDMWVFKLDLKDNLINLGDTADGAFKAQFVNASGNKVGSLLSEEATFQKIPYRELPEPASLLLVGTGLVAAGSAVRRRRKNPASSSSRRT